MVYRLAITALIALGCLTGAAEAADSHAAEAARDLLRRVLPQHTDSFELEIIPPEDDRDVFEIESRQRKIVIRGNHGLSMAMGLNWYLKHYCHCHVSWYGDKVRLPDPL